MNPVGLKPSGLGSLQPFVFLLRTHWSNLICVRRNQENIYRGCCGSYAVDMGFLLALTERMLSSNVSVDTSLWHLSTHAILHRVCPGCLLVAARFHSALLLAFLLMWWKYVALSVLRKTLWNVFWMAGKSAVRSPISDTSKCGMNAFSKIWFNAVIGQSDFLKSVWICPKNDLVWTSKYCPCHLTIKNIWT